MSPVKVFSVIVIYNGMRRDWIEKCFNSLMASETPVEIIAIDNCSKDDSVAFITSKYPAVQLIASKENLGFAKANNLGIKMAAAANADYIFLLNQDAWLVDSKDLTRMVAASKAHPEYGILSPVVFSGEGKELEYSFKSYASSSGYTYIPGSLSNGVVTVPFVNAAAWLIPRHCYEKVGGFDTRLFQHYGEDDNYNQRVSYCGLKTGIVTNAFVCHDTLSTTGVNPAYINKIRLIERKVAIADVRLGSIKTFKMMVNVIKLLFTDKVDDDAFSLTGKILKFYVNLLMLGKKVYYLD